MEYDAFQAAIAALEQIPVVGSWPEMMRLVKKRAAQHPRDWRLPILARSWAAQGSRACPAWPPSPAQISIVLLDDLLDADPRGEHQRLGGPLTANLAAALQAASLEVIARAEADVEVRSAAADSLNRMTLCVAWGQSYGAQNPTDEAAYWRVVENKSGAFFGAALPVGALLGGAAPAVAEPIRQFGRP